MNDEQRIEHQFKNYLDAHCRERTRQMIKTNESRLTFEIDSLRRFDPALAKSLVSEATSYFPIFCRALRSYVSTLLVDDPEHLRSPDSTEEEQKTYYVGVSGSFGSNQVSPRELISSFISSLVCVEGIVTKCSMIHPRIVKSFHYCEKTGNFHSKSYADESSESGIPTPANYPKFDRERNPLTTEYGLSVFRDHQKLVIQEMPERAPAGQLPRSVTIQLENDLVDAVKPGDRVQVVGIYRALPFRGVQAAGEHHQFRTVLLANHVRTVAHESAGPAITESDIALIRKVAAEADIFEKLSYSLAPSIFGHEYIKKAMLLQMMGGREKITTNGTHLRGDIHILLVGDPSTAKSQLLRFVLGVAPLAFSTTGQGASGVGLTAAVTLDPETRERTLEAGAMVLADRGIVCVDEFDKMDVKDRGAMHEVLEQQTVTIQKAGIHASLNARCSCFAAANPIYGQYNRQKTPTENIGFPDSLLSRFDLLFIVLDTMDPRLDRTISEHVLRMHRYCQRENCVPGQEMSTSNKLEDDFDDEELDEHGETTAYRNDRIYRGNFTAEVFSLTFLKKYIVFAKDRIHPKLTKEASDIFVEAYTELRSKEDFKTLPVTARTLDSMIRLSEAHARIRLSPIVEQVDAEVAVEMMNFSMYNEAKPRSKATPMDVSAVTEDATVDEANIREAVINLLAEDDAGMIDRDRILQKLGRRIDVEQLDQLLRRMSLENSLMYQDNTVYAV